jgi:SAM-dependent methyltransferase
MPTRHEVHAVYASERYAQSYDAAGQNFVVSEETAKEQLPPRFARLASYLPTKGRMLDIGASRGVFLKLAALEGWTVFGLEAGLDTIEYAQSHYGITIEHGTLEGTTLPVAYYDCVHLSHVLEHLYDPLASIRAIGDSMKSGGVLVVEVPFEFGDLFDRFRELVLRRPRAVNAVPSSHLTFFTLTSLSRLLEDSGFEILYSATPRRNQSFASTLPMGKLLKRIVYRLEQILKMGPLIEVFARKK